MTDVVLASFDRVPSFKGASRHILQNRAILESAGFAVSLVTLGEEPLAGARHLPIHLAEPNWLRRGLAFHASVRRVFEKNPFDIHHVRSPWEGLAVPSGARLVYEVNGLYSVEAAYHHPAIHALPRLREKLRTMELALLDRASAIVTPSAITRAHLEDLGVPQGAITIVPNTPTVRPPPATAPVAPREAGGPTRFCYVGTLSPWQGLSEALTALARLDDPFVVEVLTPSAERPRRELVELARSLGLEGRVHVRDPVDEDALAAFLASQDVALAPLLPCERNLVQGGMPLKILDAMAVGLPVLAPDLPIVTALLGDEHPTYRRHHTSDLVDLAAQLARSPSRRAELGAHLRERVADRFSPEAQREALLAVYRRIAS